MLFRWPKRWRKGILGEFGLNLTERGSTLVEREPVVDWSWKIFQDMQEILEAKLRAGCKS